MELNLAGRVAVVTGSGSGIGLAVVRRLLEAGVKVVGGDLDSSGMSNLDGDVTAIDVDLSEKDGSAHLIANAIDIHGGVDILINCIGIAPVREGFLALKDEDLSRTMDVNFLSIVRACRAVIPSMIERGRGSIVSVSSDAGRMPDPFFIDYALSKAAILSFSKTLSIEFGPKNIRSNVVTPGPVRTPMWDRPNGFAESLAASYGVDKEAAIERFAKVERRLPLGRLGTPDEVATLCVYLSSDLAGFATGADFAINGGSIPVI